MIIECPSCSARFTVDDAAMGQGRKVRCSDCKHIWFHEILPAEDVVEDETGIPAADPGDSEALPPAEEDSAGIDETDSPSMSIPSNLHPADSDDFYNPAEAGISDYPGSYEDDEARGPRTKASFFGVLFIVLCLFGATAAWLYGAREASVKMFPPLVRVYSAFGLETPYYAGKGISVSELTAKRSEVKGKPVLLVRGYAVNETDNPVTVPSLLIELKKGEETFSHWKTPEENFVLGGKETTSFEYGLPNPSANGDTVTVRFIGAADENAENDK